MGADVVDTFRRSNPDAPEFWTSDGDRFLFDLRAAARWVLVRRAPRWTTTNRRAPSATPASTRSGGTAKPAGTPWWSGGDLDRDRPYRLRPRPRPTEHRRCGARAAGRDPSEVTLIAVSKAFPASAIERAAAAGHQDFGENRVQELSAKYAGWALVRLAFVGSLQRNKVRQVLSTGAVIHSVDRLELASEINLRAESRVRVLLEVNVTGEPQKGGVEPEELPRLVDAALEMPNLQVVGLMTMARKAGDPELARPYFASWLA